MLLDFKKLYKKYNMKIDGVIHIGAHYGQEYLLYKELNIKNISFFEPLKKNFSVLENNIPIDEHIKLYNFALGRENKNVSMYVESINNGQSSSILKPKLHTEQYKNIIFNEIEEVEMKRLDDINLVYKHNFINIDVQGYELEVFNGSKETLKNIDYIISEVNRAELYENNVFVDKLDEFLKDYNFLRVETSWDGITWGDALYIKKEFK